MGKAGFCCSLHFTTAQHQGGSFYGRSCRAFIFFLGGESMGWKSTSFPPPPKKSSYRESECCHILSLFLSCFLVVRNQRCQLRMEGTDVNRPPFLQFYFYCATYLFVCGEAQTMEQSMLLLLLLIFLGGLLWFSIYFFKIQKSL